MIRLADLRVIAAPVERCFDLARSVEVHLLGNVHDGECAQAVAGVTTGLLDMGQQVTWRARHFHVWHELTSRITSMDRPASFQDAMVDGPFRSMRHDHLFRRLSPERTEMHDLFSVEAPLGFLGRLAETAFLRSYMRTLLQERIAIIQWLAESPEWRKYLPSGGEGRGSHETCHTRR